MKFIKLPALAFVLSVASLSYAVDLSGDITGVKNVGTDRVTILEDDILTIKSGGSLIINNPSTTNILFINDASTASVTGKGGTFNIEEGGLFSLTQSGAHTANKRISYVGNINIAGTYTANITGTGSFNNLLGFTIADNRTATVYGTGVVNLQNSSGSKLRMDFQGPGGKLVVYQGATFNTAGLLDQSSSGSVTLELKDGATFKPTGVTGTGYVVGFSTTSSEKNIILGDNTTVGNLQFITKQTVNFTLKEIKAADAEVNVTIGAYSNSAENASSNFTIRNFDNDYLFFEEASRLSIDYDSDSDKATLSITQGASTARFFLVGYDSLGTLLDADAWDLISDGGTGAYLYNSSVIPEPAAFAAIFGALALGFALMRRGKK